MNIQEVLELHERWLNGEEGGRRADLRGADLRGAYLRNADLRGADLRDADLRNADLSDADLRDANLSEANLRCANLRCANLRDADLRGADLRDADLRNANLRDADLCDADLCGANLRDTDLRKANLCDADLCGANLRDTDLRKANLCDADLCGADLSNAKNIKNQNSADYITAHFDKTGDGIIVYKTFNNYQRANPSWVIEEGSIIEENVNYNRTNECGCGVNVATMDWVKANGGQEKDIWECLIKWEWLSDVVVPYYTDGKIRAGRVQLIKIIGVV